MADQLELRLANEDDLDGVESVLTSARVWLRSKGTDQWQRSWPDDAARIARVLTGLAAGKTWVLLDGRTHVAMITVDWHAVMPGLPALWSEEDRAEPAVYDHRLAVLRNPAYIGRGLGMRLLDWSGRLAAEAYGARFVRLDAWTSNSDLHRYYKNIGFNMRGAYQEDEIACPSGALFEKPFVRCVAPMGEIVVNSADVACWSDAAREAHGLMAVGTKA